MIDFGFEWGIYFGDMDFDCVNDIIVFSMGVVVVCGFIYFLEFLIVFGLYFMSTSGFLDVFLSVFFFDGGYFI